MTERKYVEMTDEQLAETEQRPPDVVITGHVQRGTGGLTVDIDIWYNRDKNYTLIGQHEQVGGSAWIVTDGIISDEEILADYDSYE